MSLRRLSRIELDMNMRGIGVGGGDAPEAGMIEGVFTSLIGQTRQNMQAVLHQIIDNPYTRELDRIHALYQLGKLNLEQAREERNQIAQVCTIPQVLQVPAHLYHLPEFEHLSNKTIPTQQMLQIALAKIPEMGPIELFIEPTTVVQTDAKPATTGPDNNEG